MSLYRVIVDACASSAFSETKKRTSQALCVCSMCLPWWRVWIRPCGPARYTTVLSGTWVWGSSVTVAPAKHEYHTVSDGGRKGVILYHEEARSSTYRQRRHCPRAPLCLFVTLVPSRCGFLFCAPLLYYLPVTSAIVIIQTQF